MWRRERRALGAELVGDAEAFLKGRYAERLAAMSVEVPVWAWTNLLAHGDEDQLRAEAEAVCTSPGEFGAWRTARAYMAAVVLGSVTPQRPLEDLQASVLQPLELELASRPSVQRWDRQTWVNALRHALAERPTRHP